MPHSECSGNEEAESNTSTQYPSMSGLLVMSKVKGGVQERAKVELNTVYFSDPTAPSAPTIYIIHKQHVIRHVMLPAFYR